MSADGDHAIWQYNNYNGAFGLVWRDLSTGRTIVRQGLWPYGADIFCQWHVRRLCLCGADGAKRPGDRHERMAVGHPDRSAHAGQPGRHRQERQ